MKLAPVVVLAALIAACSPAAEPDGDDGAVKVADALCRPTPNGRNMTACYMTLTATGADRLVSVATPDAGRAEIHEMKTENGVMSMAEMPEGLVLPAGQATTLAPGGDHIMLMETARPLAVGDTVALTLGFQASAPVSVQARVDVPPLPGAH